MIFKKQGKTVYWSEEIKNQASRQTDTIRKIDKYTIRIYIKTVSNKKKHTKVCNIALLKFSNRQTTLHIKTVKIKIQLKAVLEKL